MDIAEFKKAIATPTSKVRWVPADIAYASKRGWGLFETNRDVFDRFEIEGIDEPEAGALVVDEDEGAWTAVLRRALADHERELQALRVLYRDSPIELWRILNYGFTEGIIEEIKVVVIVEFCDCGIEVVIDEAIATGKKTFETALVEAFLERVRSKGGLEAWATELASSGINEDLTEVVLA